MSGFFPRPNPWRYAMALQTVCCQRPRKKRERGRRMKKKKRRRRDGIVDVLCD